MEQMKSFIAAVQADAAFNEEIHSLLGDGKIAEVIEAAARKGFTITEADIPENSEIKDAEICGSINGELTEEALENVAGGTGGDAGNPYRSPTCWFYSLSGGDKCTRTTCKKPVYQLPLLIPQWYICNCFGTARCVGSLHHVPNACT